MYSNIIWDNQNPDHFLSSTTKMNLEMDLTRVKITIDYISMKRSLEHTMADSLDDYVFQKVPKKELFTSISQGNSIEVHGIFPEDFEQKFGQLGFKNINKIKYEKNKIEVGLNFLRPCFYQCKNNDGNDIFVIAVSPGHDYLIHYATMIRHFIGFFSYDHLKSLSIFHYPVLEKNLLKITGFHEMNIKIEGILILGYIESLAKKFNELSEMELISINENYYYKIMKYKAGNQVITLFGVKYSFWGKTSANIVKELLSDEIDEVFYYAKLGCMDDPENIYEKIYSPSDYFIFNHNKITQNCFKVKNNFSTIFPEISSGAHLSLPTVLEEDYKMRSIASDLFIMSIDNEISQIAKVVNDFVKDISFTALHFATDYVRNENQKNLEIEFDLSTNRSENAVIKKRFVQARIVQMIANYLSLKGKMNA